MNKAVVGGVIAAVVLATVGGGGYWYYQKQEAEKANVSSQTVSPQSATNPTMAVLAMIAAAKSGNNAAILSAKVALDSFPKPGRGNRKFAREENKLGLDALKANNYESAINRLNEGVAADPSDVEVKNNLGYALMMAGRLDEAKTTLIESLTLDSARAAAWANLGQTLAMQGDEDSAVAAFVNTFIFSRAQIKTVEFLTNLSQTDPNQRVKSAAAKALEAPLIKATGVPPVLAQAASLPSSQIERNNPASPQEEALHTAQCNSLAQLWTDRNAFLTYCNALWAANPHSSCGGDNLPCGTQCFCPHCQQQCVNGRVCGSLAGPCPSTQAPASAQQEAAGPQAQAQRPWAQEVEVDVGGCRAIVAKVFLPLPRGKVTWSGACDNGYVQGKGNWRMYLPNGQFLSNSLVEFSHGRMVK